MSFLSATKTTNKTERCIISQVEGSVSCFVTVSHLMQITGFIGLSILYNNYAPHHLRGRDMDGSRFITQYLTQFMTILY